MKSTQFKSVYIYLYLYIIVVVLYQKRHKNALTICVSSSVRTPMARDRVVCTFLDTANTLKR